MTKGANNLKPNISDNESNENNQNISGYSKYRRYSVLMAAFLSIAMAGGLPFNMSVLYVEWIQEFGKSNTETALVQSVCIGAFSVGGVLSGVMVKKFGPQVCTVAGGIFAAFGIAVSYFSTKIIHLVLCISVVTGMACSFGYISALTSVGMYFTGKKRLMALVFVGFGSGCGGSVLPVVLENLIYEYGWRGSMLILAGIMLNMTVMGCFLKVPVQRSNESKETESTRKEKDALLQRCEDNSSSENVTTGKDEILRVNVIIEKSDHEKTIFQILRDISRNYNFICFCMSQALCYATVNSSLIFFIDYFESKGLKRSEGVSIYFYMIMISNIGRLLPGFLKQLPHVSVLSIPTVSSLMTSVSLVLFTINGSTFSFNLVVACVFGIGLGGIRTALSATVPKLVRVTHLSVGIGISLTLSGIANTATGPILGFIRDKTGNYHTNLLSAAAALFTSSVFFFIIMCRHTRMRAQSHI